MRLGATLGVPLRHVNAMLDAAGHLPVFAESAEALPDSVVRALKMLKEHHEPFPLIVIDRAYRVRDLNHGALAMLTALMPAQVPGGLQNPSALAKVDLNLARWAFDPHGAQPFVVNFDEVGRALLWRLQREVLADPSDTELRTVLDDVLAMPTISPDWREVDLSTPSDPALVLHLRRGELDLRFVTMVTAFQAPQNIAVEELRIELWFPEDSATAETLRELAGQKTLRRESPCQWHERRLEQHGRR